MFRRSISSRFTTLVTRRFSPSFGHAVLRDADDESHHSDPLTPSVPHTKHFTFREFHSAHRNAAVSGGLGALFRERNGFASSLRPGLGSSFYSYSSSTIREGSDKIEYMSDVASVLTDKGVEVAAHDVTSVLTDKGVEVAVAAAATQGPVVSEVAIAAADSYFPVAALQYFIDGVHNLTGFNWWASIALTTLFIRSATVPLLINQLKATAKLALIRPEMEEIRQRMADSMDPGATVEGQLRMKALFKEHGVSPFTPLKGLFILGPVFITFFLAISNMVEKVPSFKTGGAFWFTDLTTPDSLYIFPVLTSLTFLITVELNMQEGMEGNPMAGTMKNFSRILAVLTVPFTMNFPKAIFCYWVTSNFFSFVYGYVIKRPSVKKLLALPEIVQQPPTTQPSFSLFGGSNSLFGGSKSSFGESKSTTPAVSPPSIEQSKLPDKKIISSSSVISQRLGRLEKSVKARKKNKKR